MTVLWIAAAVIVTATTVEGIRQGVVRRAAELVGLLVVFLFASRLAGMLAPEIDGLFGMDSSAAFYASWAVVLIGGVVAVRLAASGLRKIVHLTLVGWLDRAGGGVLGLAFGLVIASCLFVLTQALPVSDTIRDEMEENPAAELLLNLAPAVYDVGREFIGGERFFDMVKEHVEPAADRLRDEAAELGERASDVRG